MTVHVEENIWITLSDGCRLAARLWLPDGAARTPVPAVLEYIPYRKRDGTRARDEPMHGYFAAHGYAALRVDMRGSGESEGHLADEYLKQEQDDALEVIAWIARQAWCSGAVGIQGKSWGGFNGLQIAARRPPALKAVISTFSTDNRYTDDIHYMGGCLLNDNLWWGSIMLAYQSRPIDPQIAGPEWRERWLRRIEELPFFPALWLAHQRYDAYWKHGSICEDFAAIECPVLAIGGWADAYTNAVPRLLEGLKVPRLGIIGPWGHIYPHDGVPGPAIGYLQEAVRWWDQWLKGRDTGIMNEPMWRTPWLPPARARSRRGGGSANPRGRRRPSSRCGSTCVRTRVSASGRMQAAPYRSAHRRATARRRGNGWPRAARASIPPISDSTTAVRSCSRRHCSSGISRCWARRVCGCALPPMPGSHKSPCAWRKSCRMEPPCASATKSSISRIASVTSTRSLSNRASPTMST
jgi:pimeloyl-ACP methyl ester carboxylesterase